MILPVIEVVCGRAGTNCGFTKDDNIIEINNIVKIKTIKIVFSFIIIILIFQKNGSIPPENLNANITTINKIIIPIIKILYLSNNSLIIQSPFNFIIASTISPFVSFNICLILSLFFSPVCSIINFISSSENFSSFILPDI